MTTKKISIDDLSVGMFLEDITTDKGVLLLSTNVSIQSDSQIQALRQRGVQHVTINIKKGMDLPASTNPVATAAQKVSEDEQKFREKAYYQELEKARIIHQNTMATATEVLKSIRGGQSFSVSDVRDASEDMAKSVLRNPDALISLTQIKGFDEYTYTHSVNVSILATTLASEMGYKADALADISMGGLLHDIGKMQVPESILNKPGKLTDQEFAVMKRHPEYGLEIANNKSGISDTAKKMISQHHERFNGKGYPLGLSGQRIHECALITAVADVFDALTSQRVYKEAWTPQRTLALIFNGCDVDYSRTIAEKFTRHMGIYPVGSFVRLVSGQMGVVTRVDHGHLLASKIAVIFDTAGTRLMKPLEFDLHVLQLQKDGHLYKIESSLEPKAFGVCVSDFI